MKFLSNLSKHFSKSIHAQYNRFVMQESLFWSIPVEKYSRQLTVPFENEIDYQWSVYALLTILVNDLVMFNYISEYLFEIMLIM